MVAGASGVLLKDTSPEAIRAAVVSVHLGGHVLCADAARWVLGAEPSTHLTPRESEVLRLVAEGANNAEIAANLQLSRKTVRNYVSRLYHKLDLSNRADIVTSLVTNDTRRGGGEGPERPTKESAVSSTVNEQPLNLLHRSSSWRRGPCCWSPRGSVRSAESPSDCSGPPT